ALALSTGVPSLLPQPLSSGAFSQSPKGAQGLLDFTKTAPKSERSPARGFFSCTSASPRIEPSGAPARGGARPGVVHLLPLSGGEAPGRGLPQRGADPDPPRPPPIRARPPREAGPPGAGTGPSRPPGHAGA